MSSQKTPLSPASLELSETSENCGEKTYLSPAALELSEYAENCGEKTCGPNSRVPASKLARAGGNGAYQDLAALSSASPKKDKRNIYNVLLFALRSLHREIIIKISPPESPFIGTTSLLYLGEADESAG